MTQVLQSQRLIFLMVFMVHAMALSIELARKSQQSGGIKSAIRLSLLQDSFSQPEIKAMTRPRQFLKTPAPTVSEVVPQPKSIEAQAVEETDARLESSSSSVGKIDPLKAYGAEVQQLIKKKKIYPALAKRMDQQGEVLLRLTLDRSGKLLELQLLKASEHSILNNAALDMVKRVERFPPIPTEIGIDIISFNVPVDYTIK